MAIRGLSMSERQEYILTADPAHPDNIRSEVEKRLERSGGKVSDSTQESIRQAVQESAGEPTVFFLGNLTHGDKIYLSDLMGNIEQTREGNMRMQNRNTFRMYETVRRGLVGWENYLDETGKSLRFSQDPQVDQTGQPRKFVSEESLNHLHLDTIRELSAEILKLNGVTSELEKKLFDLSQQPPGQHSPDFLAETAQTDNDKSEDAE